MSLLIEPYSVEEFNRIPSLEDSRKGFLARNGQDVVHGELKQLFFKHNVQDIFGVQLLHSHFDLNKKQKLVELNNIATGWTTESDEDFLGGKIVATSWLIHDDMLMAYEFDFLPMSTGSVCDPADEKYQPFIEEFMTILKASGLGKVLAIRTRPEGILQGLEITQGKSNIFLPTGTYIFDEVKYPTDMTAAWFFNEDTTKDTANFTRSCWPYNDSQHDKKGSHDMSNLEHADGVISRSCWPYNDSQHDKKGPHQAGITTRSCWPWNDSQHDKKGPQDLPIAAVSAPVRTRDLDSATPTKPSKDD